MIKERGKQNLLSGIDCINWESTNTILAIILLIISDSKTAHTYDTLLKNRVCISFLMKLILVIEK